MSKLISFIKPQSHVTFSTPRETFCVLHNFSFANYFHSLFYSLDVSLNTTSYFLNVVLNFNSNSACHINASVLLRAISFKSLASTSQ